MPRATLDAFADHGDVGGSLSADASASEHLLDELAGVDVDLGALTKELERQGVESFRDSYRELLSSIEVRAARSAPEVGHHALA
jgi:transaldolase